MRVDAGHLGGTSLSLSLSLSRSLPLSLARSLAFSSQSLPLSYALNPPASLLALFRQHACLRVVSVKSVHNRINGLRSYTQHE